MARLRDPFVSTEPEVKLDDETRRILHERIKFADKRTSGFGGRSARTYRPVAFNLLYLENALVDFELIFSWSREKYPGSTEQFASDLFNHLCLIAAFPYVGHLFRES